ncbi:epimerase [Pseudonocardia sp.]|uniref:epimerase n=1 Tax=Pseudonocardia sp. TaxID=60912 RepID=UPI002616E3B2|nr:epimerase [Pseudonocardia sp.]
MGSWLVLGGTRFLSHAVAAVAVARGHEVVCVARGESGRVPDGATLLVADRDVPGALDPLRGRRFDAAVDVATMSLPWVRDALDAVDAGHWTFVSTISVYADPLTPGQGVDAPLLDPLQDGSSPPPDRQPDAYGAIKVASENAVRASHPRSLVVRAGLICGPGDRSDRFGYWPARFARGGRAVVPGVPDQPMQIVDVRDLAEWIVDSGERGLTGTVDGSGPRTTLGAVLDEIAAAVGAPDLELVPVPPEALVAAEVTPWAGPRSLPLWLPDTHTGIAARDTTPAAAAGLRTRPIADTARAALDHERTLGPDRTRRAGLAPADESRLLTDRDAATT